MSVFTVKVYIVQKASGEIIAAKLTFLAAHNLAKKFAPARVIYAIADKTNGLNIPAPGSNHPNCN
jgi:hypothetical protein